jgi:hypothetical protein
MRNSTKVDRTTSTNSTPKPVPTRLQSTVRRPVTSVRAFRRWISVTASKVLSKNGTKEALMTR